MYLRYGFLNETILNYTMNTKALSRVALDKVRIFMLAPIKNYIRTRLSVLFQNVPVQAKFLPTKVDLRKQYITS